MQATAGASHATTIGRHFITRFASSRDHATMLHFYQLKAHTDKYHKYLFANFPPGCDAVCAKFDWDDWANMVTTDEEERKRIKFGKS